MFDSNGSQYNQPQQHESLLSLWKSMSWFVTGTKCVAELNELNSPMPEGGEP